MEEIYISSYNPNWVKLFEERQKILEIIFMNEQPIIEHIGSTAVVGLDAKPVIDIMIGFREVNVEDVVRKMERAGYAHWYEDTFRDTRLFFTMWNNAQMEKRLENVHVTTIRNEFWNSQLKFRDKLRNDARLLREYSELKKELALKFKNDSEGYTEAKTKFIKKALST